MTFRPEPQTLPKRCLAVALFCLVFLASCSSSEPTNSASTASVSTAPDLDDGTSALTSEPASEPATVADEQTQTLTGAAVLAKQDFEPLAGKRVGLIANQVSTLSGTHLVDILAEADNVELVAVFAPEHGWRGSVGAGSEVLTEVDPSTGLPVFSLYGENREPTAEMLRGIDVLLFDLQDVGARYYTYISTMGLSMRAAAESGVEFVVLDRPNPIGGHSLDGPVRSDEHESFIGQYPIPTLHGLTVGELALAIVGEEWLPNLENLSLTVIEMENWDRTMLWSETGLQWIAPSPGLPTELSALTYPATVQFEATTLSYGRGTSRPFSQIGAPWIDSDSLAGDLNAKQLPGVAFEPTRFTPEQSSVAADPQYEGVEIAGVEIMVTDPQSFEPTSIGIYLLEAVLAQAAAAGESPLDRPAMFDLLAGQSSVRNGLEEGQPAAEIVASWANDLDRFEQTRKKYQIYD